MEIQDAIGIDVSKQTFDAMIYTSQQHRTFQNKTTGFRQMLSWIARLGINPDTTRFCAEHTGLYSHALAQFMADRGLHFSLVSGLEIKRSLGIKRGKDDALDAKFIAEYAYLRKGKLEDYAPPSEAVQELRKLVALRRKLVTHRKGYEVTIAESQRVIKKKDHQAYFEVHEALIKALKKQIAKVETQIEMLIEREQELRHLYLLLRSVCGIGPVIAPILMACTDCFRRFKTWRQFACYIGIAPFPYQSGTSVKGKTRVNHLANKELKALIHLAASSAILCDPELKGFYQKRIKAGKSRMSSMNIVRNKIVARVFAVVNRQTPYVKLNSFAA